MKVESKEIHLQNSRYILRSATEKDAKSLSFIRLQIDGETENLDREKGEAFLDEASFKQLIKNDTDNHKNLFLVAEVNGEIVGFSRCEGNHLKRTAHKVEFGVGVLKEFWGFGIGKHLLKESIKWADSNEVRKITLTVLETNVKAIELYRKNGFEVEGVLKDDKYLSNGKYYNTVMMGRVFQTN